MQSVRKILTAVAATLMMISAGWLHAGWSLGSPSAHHRAPSRKPSRNDADPAPAPAPLPSKEAPAPAIDIRVQGSAILALGHRIEIEAVHEPASLRFSVDGDFLGQLDLGGEAEAVARQFRDKLAHSLFVALSAARTAPFPALLEVRPKGGSSVVRIRFEGSTVLTVHVPTGAAPRERYRLQGIAAYLRDSLLERERPIPPFARRSKHDLAAGLLKPKPEPTPQSTEVAPEAPPADAQEQPEPVSPETYPDPGQPIP